MEVQVRAWGNSQGIRLPKTVLKEAGFQPDDTLFVKAENGHIVLYQDAGGKGCGIRWQNESRRRNGLER